MGGLVLRFLFCFYPLLQGIMNRASPSGRYLLRFKNVSIKETGLVHELAAIDAQIKNGGRDWRPEGVKARKIGNPTENTAIFEIESVPKLLERKQSLENLINHTRYCLSSIEYGYLLIDYYLTDDCIFWRDVALEHGISTRSVYEYSSKALAHLDAFGTDGAGMPRWVYQEKLTEDFLSQGYTNET